jgi:lysozyme
MKTGKLGKALVKEFEGCHTLRADGKVEAYLDKLVSKQKRSPGYNGLWTVGYGSTGPMVTAGTVWTMAQCEAELDKRLQAHAKVVTELFPGVNLNQNQFDALVSLSYNMGLSEKSARTLINHVRNEDWTKAADAFLLYNKAGSKVIKGLVRRREAEKKLFLILPKKDLVPQSNTLTFMSRIWKGLGALSTTFIGADALDVGRNYIDWFKEFSSNNKYLLIAAGVGIAYAMFKYVQHRKYQEQLEAE